MSAQPIELFGQPPNSTLLPDLVRNQLCPFVGGKCTKKVEKRISGACVLQVGDGRGPIVCCPKRLYAANYSLLEEIIPLAFGDDVAFVRSGQTLPENGRAVIPFGQREGREIRIPRADGETRPSLSIDWILAEVGSNRELQSFVAIEIQTIDTTGTYQAPIWDAFERADPALVAGWERGSNTAQWNLDNVRKRILPQLIRKGHILRRETKCHKGLFFVCPTPILAEITRVLGRVETYAPGSGTITFIGADYVSDPLGAGSVRLGTSVTTTVEQVYLALASPRDLPPNGVYETAISKALEHRIGPDRRIVHAVGRSGRRTRRRAS